jgi:hypothetical protein
VEVFIGNLPETATLLDLSNLLVELDLRADLRFHQGRDRHDRDYHFLVARLASQEEGRAMIAKLDGHLFEGRRIEAREYFQRTLGTRRRGDERRLNPW